MSKKYINKRKFLFVNFDEKGTIYEQQSCNNKLSQELSDSNNKLLQELSDSNNEGNLEKYIELFSLYINDKNIYNYHIYTDHPPYDCEQIFYTKCMCNNKDIFVKFFKGLYEQPCNCMGGKRYLALKYAYFIELKKKFNADNFNMIGLSIAELFEYFKCDIETFEKSPIIKYIENSGFNDIDYKYKEWV